MENLFLQLCRMSLSAGWMILAVMAVRPFLKKAPRALVCLLWGLAALRLLVPITLKSRVSLVPAQTALPDGLRWAAPTVPVQTVEAVQQTAPISFTAVLAWVWAAGALLMTGYAIFSYVRLYRRVQVSLRTKGNIYLCDSIPSPFILGVVRPKIYIPSALTEDQANFVLAHEQSHLHRGDHLWKPLGYLLLSVYWFNPLCWAAYALFCRDMEVACDERVVKPMEKAARSAYSSTLLECSVQRSMISACPLAFGEVGVKARIRSVLNYRKPAAWVVAISCILSAVLACCFLTDPVQAEQPEQSAPTGASAVLAVGATLRQTPGGEALAELSEGTRITVLGGKTLPNNETWAEIYCPEKDATGWIEDAKAAFTAGTAPISHTEAAAQPLFAAPNASSRSVGQLNPQENFIIELQTVWGSASGLWVWGTCSDQNITGWLMLPNEYNPDAEPATQAMAVTTVNVRTAPDLQSPAVGMLHLGDYVNILRWNTVDDITWCYVNYQNGNSYGWVVCNYLKQPDLQELGIVEETAAQDITIWSTVMNTAAVYDEPSYAAQKVATLDTGTTVTVQLSHPFGSTGWCFVSDESGNEIGWVDAGNLSAVADTIADLQNTGVYDLAIYQGSEAAAEVPETATLLDLTEVMSAPSDQARAVHALSLGKTVTVHKREIVADKIWCYISCDNTVGWVHSEALQYQELPTTLAEPTAPELTTGTLKADTDVLSSPSSQARTVSTLASGSTVIIQRREDIANTEWCYIESMSHMVTGWIKAESLSSVTAWEVYEATVFPEAAMDAETAVVLYAANVRSAPSAQARTVGSLEIGKTVTIHQWEAIADHTWCYISCDDLMGWVISESLQHHELETHHAPTGSVPAEVNTETVVYTSPSTQARTFATLTPGTAVSIQRQEKVGLISWCYIVNEDNTIVGWTDASNLTANVHE